MEHPPELPALIGLGAIFTLFFVSLGPIKILGPFSQLTRDLDEGKMNWQISMAAVTLAGAIIFFIVGLRLLLEQYQPASAPRHRCRPNRWRPRCGSRFPPSSRPTASRQSSVSSPTALSSIAR